MGRGDFFLAKGLLNVGIFKRLFGHDAAPEPIAPARPPTQTSTLKISSGRDVTALPANAVLLGGHGRIDVRGESTHQDELDAICGGKCPQGHGRKVLAILQPERDNRNDSNAISVEVDGRTVGYMARKAAAEYAPIADLLTEKGKIGAARAFIAGGWKKGGDEGHYGITLELSPTEELMNTRKVSALLWKAPPPSAAC